MRLTANLLLLLLFASIIVALSAGLIMESAELQQLSEQARSGDCGALRSNFSHLRFVGYHLALLMAAIAAIAYAVLVAISFALRWMVDLFSRGAL